MALFDSNHGVIVVRIVYDGPAYAGKTTTVRGLAAALGRTVETPHEENGRTTYFDWLDYTGGHYAGYQVRCQVVSVPGQHRLRARRLELLRSADAIVYVADTTAERIDQTTDQLREIPALLREPKHPVGLILQANKRDLPDAISLPALRRHLEATGLHVGVVESIASDGSGIRDAFVLAVRLALDRVRALIEDNTLTSGRPDVNDADELMATLMAAEAESSRVGGVAPVAASVVSGPNGVEAGVVEEIVSAVVRRGAESPPPPPDPTAPSGLIWPPVGGRVVLHEACGEKLEVAQQLHGGWAASGNDRWQTASHSDAVFSDLGSGRAELVQWARLHASFGALLSRRCIVLAECGKDAWRLWQVVRAEASLRKTLDDLHALTVDEIASRLYSAITVLADMDDRLAQIAPHLPCTLATVGLGARHPFYVGLMPARAEGPRRRRDVELVIDELAPIMAAVSDRRVKVRAAMRRLPTRAHNRADVVAASIKALLG